MVTKSGLSVYEGIIPGRTEPEQKEPFRVISELDDKRLYVTGEGAQGFISEDAGRTWSSGAPQMQGGAPMESSRHPEVGSITTIALLNNGDLAMVYSKQANGGSAGYKAAAWYFATSSDDGVTWSEGHSIDIPSAMDVTKGWFVQFLWKNIVQLSSGRLVIPAYWEIAGRHPGMPPAGPDPVTATIQGKFNLRVADGHLFEAAMGGCYSYQSDDMGKTWEMCTGSTMVWPLPGEDNIGGFGVCWEPDAIELKDGRVLMVMRTNVGRLYQSFSEDGGDFWSLPEPMELATGDIPCAIGRLRTTGDLVMVWNQSSVQEIEKGYSRGRLSVAISRDEGGSWENFKTVELSEGMEDMDRVELPPIKHVRPLGDLGVLPDAFLRSHYPQVAFVQGNLIIVYQSDTWPGGNIRREHKLQIVPEERLYD